MATAIINSQMDAINESFSNISSDLTTIRPLLKNATIGAYPTDTARGSIASFTDGAEGIPVKSLSVDLEPVQDLNGYDNPWPAGGGKNKLKVELTSDTTNQVTFTVNADGTISLSGTANALTVRQINQSVTLPAGTYIVSGCPSGGGNSSYSLRVGNVIVDETGNGASFTLNAETTTSVSLIIRNGVNVTGKVFKPMICLSTATDPTVFAPYENICPISGHTEVNVYRTGKNLFDFKSDYSGWGGGYIKTDGTASGTTPTAPAYERVSPFIGIEGGTAYTFSVNVDTTSQKSMNWALYDADKNFISGTHGGQYSSAPVTVIAPSTAAYFRVSLRTYNIAKDYQLELGSTATDYEPYAGQTYNVPLGQTVYGGTLNVTTGVLTINRAITTIGALNWAYYTSDSTFRSSSLVDSILTNSAYIDCEAFKQVAASAGATSDMCIWVTSGGGLRIKNSNYTDSSAFKTAFTDTQFTYELATPITVQLTATQVSTLLGENNVWSDAGTVSVVYRADTGLYIDKKLAQALNA